MQQGEGLRLHVDTDSVRLRDPLMLSVELKDKQLGIHATTAFKAAVPLVCVRRLLIYRHSCYVDDLAERDTAGTPLAWLAH